MPNARRGIAACIISIAAAYSEGPAAHAQTPQQSEWCEGKGGALPDLQISACTALIQSGKLAGKALAAAFSNRGNAYNIKHEYDRAIPELDQSIKLDPQSAIAFNNRGIAYKNKRQYDRAIADLDQAIRLDPSLAAPYNNRGNAYDSQGQYDRAIADYDQAIRINPQYAFAYRNRGGAYDSKGQHDRAIADFD